MSDSVRPHRRQPTRLPCTWDSPGKNTGVGCHSFSNEGKWKVKVKLLSRVWLFATPWTAACQAPPSMGFSRQEYQSGVPLPSPIKYEVLSNFKKGVSQHNWTKALELSLVLPSMATIAWGTQSCLLICPWHLPISNSLSLSFWLYSPNLYLYNHTHSESLHVLQHSPTSLDWPPLPIDWDLQPKTQPTTTSDHRTQTCLNFIPKGTWGDWRILSRGIMPTHLMLGKVMLASGQGMETKL